MYCAQLEVNGQIWAFSFPAEDQEDAEGIAFENGWDYLGELVDDEDVSDQMLAAIDLWANGGTVH